MANPLAAKIIQSIRNDPGFAFEVAYSVRAMSALGPGWGLNREDRKVVEEMLAVVKRFVEGPDFQFRGDVQTMYRCLRYIMENFGKYNRQWSFFTGKTDNIPGKEIKSGVDLKAVIHSIAAKAKVKKEEFARYWIDANWYDDDFVTSEIQPLPKQVAPIVASPPALDNGYGDW